MTSKKIWAADRKDMKSKASPEQIKILQHLVSHQLTMGNIMQILAWPPSKFDDGFMLANELQNLDLVKLLYSSFNKNQIVVELTLLGKEVGQSSRSN